MPFFDILRLQGDHTAHAHKSDVIFIFSKSFQAKKNKALRSKMTKIASRGPALKGAGSKDEVQRDK